LSKEPGTVGIGKHDKFYLDAGYKGLVQTDGQKEEKQLMSSTETINRQSQLQVGLDTKFHDSKPLRFQILLFQI
jgi:hypothetical protein